MISINTNQYFRKLYFYSQFVCPFQRETIMPAWSGPTRYQSVIPSSPMSVPQWDFWRFLEPEEVEAGKDFRRVREPITRSKTIMIMVRLPRLKKLKKALCLLPGLQSFLIVKKNDSILNFHYVSLFRITNLF